MEIVNFTKEEFESKVLPRYFTSGDQADFYSYEENARKFALKIYRHPLDIKSIKNIKRSFSIPDDCQMLKPIKLVMIDDKIYGFLSELKMNYYNMKEINLELEQKFNFLIHVKNLVLKLLDKGICFYNIDSGNILYNGKDILLCSIPNAYLFSDLGKQISDKELINLVYKSFNIFTIAYLNDISLNKVKEKIEDVLISWFNLREYEELIGVTDNQLCMGICYDLFYDRKDLNNRNELLINYIDRDKIKQKTF